MIAVDEGAYILAGTVVTQVVVLIGLVIQIKTKRASDGAYEAVNGVDKENGEPKLIDQVRESRRRLDRLEAMNAWKVGVLQQIADQVGVDVPPLPPGLEQGRAA